MQPIRERGDIMKLENLIDALDSMMNLSSKQKCVFVMKRVTIYGRGV